MSQDWNLQERTHWQCSLAADHKVLSEDSESRNHHRYAVVVQDLATQWISISFVQNRNFSRNRKELTKFLAPTWKPKVIYADTSLEFVKHCEDLSWNHRTPTPHRSETNGVAERAVRRIERRDFCCSQVLGGGWISMEFYCYLRNTQDLLSDGKTPYEGDSANH